MSIELNTTARPCKALILEEPEKVAIEHGGIATMIKFDKLERMSLMTFLEQRLPNKHMMDKDDLYVVRDVNANRVSLITQSDVYCYHTTEVGQATLDDLIANLKTTNSISIVPDIQYPLVAYATSEGNTFVCVKLDSMNRPFKRVRPTYEETIWTPPVWFSATFTPSLSMYTRGAIRLAVVPKPSLKASQARLKLWPLGNVGNSGGICFGSTVVKDAYSVTTVGQALQRLIDNFFNSLFNSDLSNPVDNLEGLIKAFKECSLYDKYKSKVNMSAESAGLGDKTIMTAAVMHDKGGWRKLTFQDMDMSALAFMTPPFEERR